MLRSFCSIFCSRLLSRFESSGACLGMILFSTNELKTFSSESGRCLSTSRPRILRMRSAGSSSSDLMSRKRMKWAPMGVSLNPKMKRIWFRFRIANRENMSLASSHRSSWHSSTMNSESLVKNSLYVSGVSSDTDGLL